MAAFRTLWAVVAVGIFAAPLAAQTPAEPTPAQPKPAEKGKARTVNSKALLTDAYEKTKTAETIDEFASIAEMCERALAAKLPEPNAAYAHQLAAWAYNRRGERFAEEAAALIQNGEDRKANELDAMALADFEESLKHDAKKWKALHNRGVSLGLHGKYAEALADFDQVVELKPDFASAWFNRAEVRSVLGRYGDAIDDYAQGLELIPGDGGMLIGRGSALFRLQKYDESLADFEAALAADAANPVALAGRGDAHAALGHFEQAAEDYRQAVEKNENLGRAYRGAAWLMATCPDDKYRNEELALDSAKRAIQLDGDGDWLYLDVLAAAQANAGKFAEARETLQKAIQIAPDPCAAVLRQRLGLYGSGQPYRVTAAASPSEETLMR
jgi:tetratricopeptide (TPR) repeat protein